MEKLYKGALLAYTLVGTVNSNNTQVLFTNLYNVFYEFYEFILKTNKHDQASHNQTCEQEKMSLF